MYLSGATELRHGSFGTPTSVPAEVLAQLTPEQFFDALAIRVDGPGCGSERLTVDVDLTDTGDCYRLILRNGALSYTRAPQQDAAEAVLHVPAAALAALMAGAADPGRPLPSGVRVDGDPAVLGRLLGALDAPDPDCAIVTP